MHALMSPGGSPGVTVTALACSYAWGGRCLLAECDPSGGGVLAGFLKCGIEDPKTLLDLAMALAHNSNPAILWEHVVALDQTEREWLLLPGVNDPRQVRQLDGAWPQVADCLRTACADVVDVLIDVGQVGGRDTPMALLAACDSVTMLLTPTLSQAAAAKPRLDEIARRVGDKVPVGLALVGKGEYTAAEVSRELFGLPVLAEIKRDRRSADVFSKGRRARASMRVSGLLRGAAALGSAMRRQTANEEREEAAGERVATA